MRGLLKCQIIKSTTIIGIRKDNGKVVIKIDPQYFRPTEVNSLLGDATKAHEKLGWRSQTSLEELVSDMINNDLQNASKKAPKTDQETTSKNSSKTQRKMRPKSLPMDAKT